MDMIRPNHLFFSNFSYRVAFFPLFHPHRHVFMHCCIHSHKSLQCCFDEGAGGRSEEDSVCEGGGDEVRRYIWLDFTVECLKWLTSARGFAPFATFFFFAWKFCSERRGCYNPGRAQTHRLTFAGGEEKNPLCILISSPHTHTLMHTLCPSPPRPLSSQRHRDIFISRKALTLMKHRRHKYISMIFHIWLLPPMSWHTRGFVPVNLSQHVTYQIVLLHFSDNFTFKNRHLIVYSGLKPH